MMNVAVTIDDDELLQRWRAGENDAGSELYERHRDDVQRYARRLSRGMGDPEDIVAEAYTKVLGAIRRGQGPRDGFRRYLFTAVRTCAFDVHRGDHAIDDEVPEREDDRSFDDVLAADSPMLLAFAELPERAKRILWLLEVEGWTASEVARMVGATPGAVSALAYRSRTQLRRRYLSQLDAAGERPPVRRAEGVVIDLRDDVVIDLTDRVLADPA